MFYLILTTSNKHVGLACASSWWHFKISVNQELTQEVFWGWRGSRFGAFQEKGARFCFLLCHPPSSASLPSCENRKEARLGVLSELLAASRSLELAGWALTWKWWVPDSRRPFRKEKTGKTQWITKITQWSQVWNGTPASSFIDGMQQGGMWREGEGAWCLASRWNWGKTTSFLAHSPYKKATAEASSGRIGALGICVFYPTI